MSHRRHVDLPPLDVELEKFGNPRPDHRELNRGPGIAPERRRCPLGRPAVRLNALHLDNAVSGFDPRLVRGRSGHGRDHREPAVGDFDPEPEPAIVAPCGHHQVFQLLGAEEAGVRIAEILEHSVDGQIVELALFERVDVEVRNALHDTGEDSGLPVDPLRAGSTPLQEQAPEPEGHGGRN